MSSIPPRVRLVFRRLCLVLGVVLLLLGLATAFLLKQRPYLLVAWRFRAPPSSLTIPVEGMATRSLKSTFLAPRDGGQRKHQGADLFAVRGTRVLSASHGVVVKVGTDRLGGNVVTVLGEGPAFYYYAHLDEWAPGMRPGNVVSPGTVLGTVGNTGNARTTPPHLHFGIYELGWRGVSAIDPVARLQRLSRKPAGAPHRRRAPLRW